MEETTQQTGAVGGPPHGSSAPSGAIPDFSTVELGGPVPADAGEAGQWAAAVQQATGKGVADLTWETPEGIDVKPLYTDADLDGLDFLGTYPGITPYLRGPYPTMYVNQPWTIRQYAGFSTAEESNAFYRRNLAAKPEGPVRRLRPAHAPRLRQRPPAGDRRCRHGGRRHRLHL